MLLLLFCGGRSSPCEFSDVVRSDPHGICQGPYSVEIQGGPKKRPIMFQDLITALVIDIFV